MRHLLNTLFALSEDSYLRLENSNVVVQQGEEIKARYPLHTLESILCFSYRGVSPALMGACAESGIALSFFTPTGRYLASVSDLNGSNVLLRKTQYAICAEEAAACRIARNMVLGKCYNARWMLERAARDHADRVDVRRIKAVSRQLYDALPALRTAERLETIQGVEGRAAAAYFSVLDEFVLQNADTFHFVGRSRRPPLDPLNAALSFVYTLLAHDCAAALRGVGLDPQMGVLHQPRSGRDSLALDLMEEFRCLWGDRFVLTLINGRKLLPRHFDTQPDGAVYLSVEGRKIVLVAWQERKRETVEHPYLHEKLPRGLLPYVQALLLARTIRGDLNEYPPYLWKC